MATKIRRTIHAIIADAVGLGHCIVANLVVIVGYFFELQLNPDSFDGLKFIYRYVDIPVYYFFYSYMGNVQHDDFYTIVLGEIVIIISSVLYGLVAYILARAFFPAER